MSRLLPILLVAILSAGHAADAPSSRQRDQERLKPFGGLVGEWKGTGQVQRGSAKGAWVEKDKWSWKLANDSAALELTTEKGKFFKQALLHPGADPGVYRLDLTLNDETQRSFTGKVGARQALILTAEKPPESGPARVTITPLHETRFLMLVESTDATGGYQRMGEIGATRQGVSFAAGDSAPVCIVTEGRGTMTVSYKGKTYPVCCSGCKDLFNENPEEILKEAAERAKAKKSEK